MPAALTGPLRLLLLWGLLAVVVPTRSKGQEAPLRQFLALCLDRGATALMSGELVPLKPLPGRKKSHLVLAVGMAAGQEHGCRAAAWEEGFPACPVLLLPGGALGLLLAWQSINGSGRELLRDRSMATPFSCSQMCPTGAETLPLPAS